MIPPQAILTYYDGAYRPTIRIAIWAREDIIRLQGLFTSLADGSMQQIQLHTQEFLAVTDLHGLTLYITSTTYKGGRNVRLQAISPDGPSFNWSRDVEGWLWCVGLLDGLIENDGPGHQYLSGDGDDALVEVTFKES